MPSEIAHLTVSGKPRLFILLLHASDTGLQQAFRVMEKLSEASHIKPFLLVEVGGETEGAAGYTARILKGGQYKAVELLDAVHRTGALDRVDLFSTCTASLNDSEQHQVVQSAGSLVTRLQRLAHKSTEIAEHRLFFPDYGSLSPTGRFFDGGARSGLVVLPEDRQFESAIAMPLSLSEPETHSWHVAVELLSLAGLWSTMEGAPIESVRWAQSGLDIPLVHLVRSMVRTSRFAAPSINELFGSEESLPIPFGKEVAPDPFYFVHEVAKEIHPPEFKLAPEEPFDPGGRWVRGPRILAQIVGRIGRDIINLPKTVRRGIQQEFEDQTASFAKGLIETDSWVGEVWPGSDADTQSIDEIDIVEVIEAIESRERRATHTTFAPESWDHVLQTTLGAIDGSVNAETARQTAGSETFVVVDRIALGPDDSDNFSSVATKLGGTDGDADIGHDEGSARSQASLLGSVTELFKAEERKSNDRCARLLNNIRELANPESRLQPGMTLTIQVCFYASLVIAAVAVTSLSPFHEQFDPSEYLRAVERLRLFVVMTVLASIPIAFLYFPSDHRRRQVYVACLAVLIVPGAVFAFVRADWILSQDLGRNSQLPAALTALTITALSLFVHVRPRESEVPKWRDPAGRAARYVMVPYAIGLFIAWLNMPNTRPSAIEANESSLFPIVLISATAVFLVSAAASSIAHLRDENRMTEWRRRFRWLVDNANKAVDDRKAVSALTVHWLGTATVIARLINRPYGNSPSQASATETQTDWQPPILKVRALNLNLTPEGQEDFLDRASPMLSAPGWLTTQYRRIADAFVVAGRGRYGTRDDGNTSRPESCAYPVELNSALAGRATGRRWPFTYKVYEGSFDSDLRQAAEVRVAQQALIETFLEDLSVCQVGSGADDTESLDSVFQEIIPDGQQTFSLGVLGEGAVSFTGSETLDCYIWWPKDIPVSDSDFSPTHAAEHHDEDSSVVFQDSERHSEGRSVIFQAVRVDISEPLRCSDLISPPATGPGPPGGPAANSGDEPPRPLL